MGPKDVGVLMVSADYFANLFDEGFRVTHFFKNNCGDLWTFFVLVFYGAAANVRQNYGANVGFPV